MKNISTEAKMYKETLEQIWDKIETVLGPMTTGVIFKKVILKTQNQYPFLEQLSIDEKGISFNHLEINDKELQEGFESLINNLFDLLTNLSGDILVRQIKRGLLEFQELQELKGGRK